MLTCALNYSAGMKLLNNLVRLLKYDDNKSNKAIYDIRIFLNAYMCLETRLLHILKFF